MAEDCEKECFFFRALEHIDISLVLLNKRAREVTRQGGEFPGSIGSLCGSCVAIKKNTALKDEAKHVF